ncbi:uncharacterized protein BJX67DRAFT_117662 [Aspergillus lucknowensis]|uniref:Secreted protein n=1 Tax=Aspergillus lucknowensis TaxID=176173 RepID=A0ABR4LRS3_9EURO
MVFLGWLMADRALTGLSRLGPLLSIQAPCLVGSEPQKHHSVKHAVNVSHMVCHRSIPETIDRLIMVEASRVGPHSARPDKRLQSKGPLLPLSALH